jgi:hypothetical protein
MKKLLLLALLSVSLRAATISGTITYTFASATACSATVNTNCMVGFSVGYMAGATFTPVSQVALPATLSGTVAVPVPAFQFNGVYGASIQFGVAVIVHDLNGNSWTTPPFLASSTSTVPPASATGLTLSVGP